MATDSFLFIPPIETKTQRTEHTTMNTYIYLYSFYTKHPIIKRLDLQRFQYIFQDLKDCVKKSNLKSLCNLFMINHIAFKHQTRNKISIISNSISIHVPSLFLPQKILKSRYSLTFYYIKYNQDTKINGIFCQIIVHPLLIT